MLLKGPSKGRFEQIFSEGKKSIGAGLRVYALPGSGHIGITTAKALGTHVARNRIKRRAREAIRFAGGPDARFDWVLLVGTKAATLKLIELSDEWRNLSTRTMELWAGALGCS